MDAALICAACGEVLSTEPARCPACDADPLLEGRYRLRAVVGQGAMGVTYRAERLTDGLTVAVKELPFRRMDSNKTHQLFEREARVLRQLDHPGIPRYIDDFITGTGKNTALVLIQEFIDGPTLAAELKDRRYTEVEVLKILDELLEILVYLHGLAPPVIHRDIKPQNVMRRRADGRLVLVDFGAVRDVVRDARVGGSTVVGTFGYMAPEQYQGIALPGTDLYALGALAVELLGRQAPDSLLDSEGVLQWEPAVRVSAPTAVLLTRMLARRVEERASSAARLRGDLRRILDGDAAPPPGAALNAPFIPPAPNAPPVLLAPPLSDVYVQPAEAPIQLARTQVAPSKLPLLLGLSVGLLVVGAVASIVLQDSAPSTAHKANRVVASAPVARGLKGLRFGMTRAEAEEALPALKDAPAEPAPQIEPFVDGLNVDVDAILTSPRLPGTVSTVKTELGNFPAECLLEFVVADTLSKMTCTLDPLSSEESHHAAELAILDSLEENYGSVTGNRTMSPFQSSGRWEWADGQATLTLESTYNRSNTVPGLTNRSKLIVTNTAAEHDRLLWDLRRQQAAKREEARRAQEAEHERKAQEELKRLQKPDSTLKDDL